VELLDVVTEFLQEVVEVLNPFDLCFVLLLEFYEKLVGVEFG